MCGCGGKEGELSRAAVRGTVQLNGVPLDEGVVRFVPAQGTRGPKTSVPVADGQFEVPDEFGPIVGTHRVEIESTDGGYPRDDEHAIARLKAQGRGRIHVVSIPPIYNSHSRLTAEIEAEGPNEFDFTLSTNLRRAR
jgi:hypothetical protein